MMVPGSVAPRRVALRSFGCRTNQEELAVLQSALQTDNYSIVDDMVDADIVIVNSCTVTAHTEKKTRRLLQTIRKKYPDKKIMVTGCLAQQSPTLLRQESADWVVGNTYKYDIPAIIANNQAGVFHAAVNGSSACLTMAPVYAYTAQSPRVRLTIKIQEGCNHACAYCIVPQVRGTARSAVLTAISETVRRAVDLGYRELVLSGTHIGQYVDEASGTRLDEMVASLSEINGDFRIRLSSLDPRELSDNLLDLIAHHPRICRHLHVSLQHLSADVLRGMGRFSDQDEQSFERLTLFRQQYPNVGLGADLMVGFPGETERDFELLCQGVGALRLSYAHVFKYSCRPGTAAMQMDDQVPEELKTMRSLVLKSGVAHSRAQFMCGCLGMSERILSETMQPVSGLTSNYLRLTLPENGTKNCWHDVIIDRSLIKDLLPQSGESLV